MDSSIAYEKSTNPLHSFLQQHHQHVQHHHQQQLHQQQQMLESNGKLDSSDPDLLQQENNCGYNNRISCDGSNQADTTHQTYVACANPHGIDTILNRRGLVSVAGGSTGKQASFSWKKPIHSRKIKEYSFWNIPRQSANTFYQEKYHFQVLNFKLLFVCIKFGRCSYLLIMIVVHLIFVLR